MGPWVNVLDPRFNLHLRADRIASAWAVRKPSQRGDVHSLELYDADGLCFCQIFGARKSGDAERPDWRALITGVEG
jgi:putative hemin transport protein